MSREHVHLSEAELIELALAPAARPDALTDCETCRARALELAGFLNDCRAELGDGLEESTPAPGFVEGVLARTTREDLGWRGDLRLVGSFVSRRLRSSPVLRFAAASIAVHLFVLPVLAWMALREARQEHILSITIQAPPEQTLPAVPMEPELALLAPDPGPEPELVEVPLAEWSGAGSPDSTGPPDPTGPEVLRVVRRHRSFLRGTSAPEPATLPAPQKVLGRLFLARSQGLHGARGPTLLPRAAAGLERALLAEVLLDTWIFDARPSARLEAVLRELGADPAVPLAERRLELLSLTRAATYGLLDGEGRARREQLERELRAQGGPRTPEPSSTWAAWSAELERCLEQRPAADRLAAGGWPTWER